jgi:phosphoribosyl 1,2-cyclic phosphodiesterase
MARLITVGSSSVGNAYSIDAGGEILLLEAGCKMADVKRAINFRFQDVVGCVVTHVHGDHCKYATEYAKFGVNVYGPHDIADKKQFPYDTYHVLQPERTYHIGDFDVVPFKNYHDVEIYGYLIRHKEIGTMLFSTDSYKIGMTLRGIDHFLIEANYEDSMLKENVRNGSISKAQSDRIMLSHMSLNYCIEYLRDCEADKSAKTITLCHLSERNSNQQVFRDTVAGVFGIPTYIAHKGTIVELNKKEI